MVKFHLWTLSGQAYCTSCNINKDEVDAGYVSRRCTGFQFHFFAGVNYQNNPHNWWFAVLDHMGEATQIGGFYAKDAKAKYDPYLDIVDETDVLSQYYDARLESNPVRQHVMGLDAETIDWDAYRAFMRDLQT